MIFIIHLARIHPRYPIDIKHIALIEWIIEKFSLRCSRKATDLLIVLKIVRQHDHLWFVNLDLDVHDIRWLYSACRVWHYFFSRWYFQNCGFKRVECFFYPLWLFMSVQLELRCSKDEFSISATLNEIGKKDLAFIPDYYLAVWKLKAVSAG